MELNQQGFSFKVTGTTVDFTITHYLADDTPIENLFNGWRRQATSQRQKNFANMFTHLIKAGFASPWKNSRK